MARLLSPNVLTHSHHRLMRVCVDISLDGTSTSTTEQTTQSPYLPQTAIMHGAVLLLGTALSDLLDHITRNNSEHSIVSVLAAGLFLLDHLSPYAIRGLFIMYHYPSVPYSDAYS